MSYNVSILRIAQKELATLTSKDYQAVSKHIEQLASTPRPSGCKKLVARPGWRIRVGRYRVIYEIDDTAKSILILHIGHRKDVYG